MTTDATDQRLDWVEVEIKCRVERLAELEGRLLEVGAQAGPAERHADTYYGHPCRDFAVSGEALRIRRIDGKPFVTYKAAKLPGAIKARREMEWHLGADDPTGNKTAELWTLLGFREVATVLKERRPFRLTEANEVYVLSIDSVDRVGLYAEVERLVRPHDVAAARESVRQVATRMGLGAEEPRSYLRMLLEGQ